MTATADEVKAEVLETAKKVHESGLVVGTAGNISGKMPYLAGLKNAACRPIRKTAAIIG